MEGHTSSFEGTAGRLAGPVMARMNRDMELAAIDELDPAPDASVLAVGFGPGVGIAELVLRLQNGVVGGVDPSSVMVKQAHRRNAAAVESGQVSLQRSTAESVPWPDGTFAGALAVNSLQLWEPLDASIREVQRVLAPAGRLVTMTHVWAIEKRSPLEEWVQATSELLRGAGFEDVAHRTASFRSGVGLVLRAEKPGPRSPTSATR
jgi:ubiquinone/menaquinone biosynthesis C-methylase UbiE